MTLNYILTSSIVVKKLENMNNFYVSSLIGL